MKVKLRNKQTGEVVEKEFYPAYADFQLSTGPLRIGWYTWSNPIVSYDIGAYYPDFVWEEVKEETTFTEGSIDAHNAT